MKILTGIIKSLVLLLFIIALFSSCIEKFTPSLNKSDAQNLLVVEGQITDEPGPFKVRLTRSVPVYTFERTNIIVPVTDADVHIFDDRGNAYRLNPGNNGWYETGNKNLKGVPGNNYTLQITDYDGTIYESTTELMPEVPPVDSVFFEEEQRIRIEGEDVYLEDWLNILLNTQSSDNGIHYYKWEFEETWEFKMPEYIKVVKHYFIEQKIIDSQFIKLVEIDPEKLHCWVSEASKSILVKSTSDNLSGEVNGFPLTSIGPEDDRLGIRYSILVKQYTLNKELYDFFKKLEKVNETNGGMYDKMPIPLYGNIQSVSGNTKALGYFLASGVKTKRIFIDHLDVHIKTGHSAYSNCGWEYPPLIGDYYSYGAIAASDPDAGTIVWSKRKYCTDCRERGTNVKPDFW